MINETARDICEALQNKGFEAFLVGGCVRDNLLEETPKDWDIATSATPDQIRKVFFRGDFQIKEVGESFGVVLLKKDGEEFEVATFRTDQFEGETDSRRPSSVKFGCSAEEDARRRDFTFNGIFMNPVDGSIHDWSFGFQDLNSKLVRFIGDPEKRIEEDALRMLRAIRFALKPGFEIECSSFAAIRRNAEKVSRISAERVTLELEKMIACQDPKRALTLLDTSDLLFLIIPELSRLQGTLQDSFWHPEGDAWKHTLLVASALRGQSFELQFAGWLHDIGKAECTRYDESDGRIHSHSHEKISADMAEKICDRLKFSTERKEHIVWLVLNHMKFHQNGSQMKKSTLRRLMASPYFGDLEKLTLADIVSSNMDFTEYDAIQDRIAAIEIEGPRRELPPPLVTGEDLIRKGLKPGPIFKVILTRIQDMQLEGILSTREDALEKLGDMISQL